MKTRVIVRSQLWVESVAGLNPAGARVFKGNERGVRFPMECVERGELNFVFDDPAVANRAAEKLADYINKNAEGKR